MCFLAYYQLNIEYITEVYCVNKEKIELACNGKCHLAKQLQLETKSQEKDNAFKITSEVFSLVFFENLSNFTINTNLPLLDKRVKHLYNQSYSYSFNYKCFRPPMC